MKGMIIGGLLITLSACASHDVRCGSLRPINAPDIPVPGTHAAAPTPTPTPTAAATGPGTP
jgi:hypothetical protein